MQKAIPVLLLTLVLAGAGFWYYRAHQRPAETGVLELHGNVDIREVNLGFRVAGRLKQVLRDEGDEVKKGETLARLDDEPYRLAADEARAQVESLQARLTLLESGNRPQEIAQAKAQFHEREVSAANAERIYHRQEELFKNRTVSIQERDDAEANYREAAARLNSAREQLNLLEAGFRVEEVDQAKAALTQAQAALASAQLRVQDTVLTCPSDGVVLTRAEEPGAILAAGATVLTVSLRQPVWVRAYVQEPELGKIHPGMKTQVYSDSNPGKSYNGTIGYISPEAEFTPKNVETTELRTSLVYRLRVVIENPDEGLRQGMPVTVKVNL